MLVKKREVQATPTLSFMLNDLRKGPWRHLRTYSRNTSQALACIRVLGDIPPEKVTPEMLHRLIEVSLKTCSPATVNVRLSVLRSMGVKTASSVRQPAPRKWYLRPEDEAKLNHFADLEPLALAFIQWTCATGFRVEETLRLQWRDISEDGVVQVPGTKTVGSDAPLPLSAEALAVLAGLTPGDGKVFPIAYRDLRREWEKARRFLGYSDIPTATLKALRRSFTRRAHTKGMPLDILRQYLRHGNVRTTMSYLNLVGGYSVDEMRRSL